MIYFILCIQLFESPHSPVNATIIHSEQRDTLAAKDHAFATITPCLEELVDEVEVCADSASTKTLFSNVIMLQTSDSTLLDVWEGKVFTMHHL